MSTTTPSNINSTNTNTNNNNNKPPPITNTSDKAANDKKIMLERAAAAQNARDAILSNINDVKDLEFIHQQVPIYVDEHAFKETVKENQIEFDMTIEDAIQDAIKQFTILKRIVQDDVIERVRLELS
jgi:hypothetical protein